MWPAFAVSVTQIIMAMVANMSSSLEALNKD